jgi:hypothetical protein
LKHFGAMATKKLQRTYGLLGGIKVRRATARN